MTDSSRAGSPSTSSTSSHGVVARLEPQFAGTFGPETIERFVVDSLDKLTAHGEGHHLPAAAQREVRPGTAPRARHASKAPSPSTPAVLFLCVHNAGRSQMAAGWLRHLAGDRVVVWSGGSEPTSEINPAAVAAMAEVGIDITDEFPKPWTDEIVRAADVVITMGCGDACPLYPGKRYEDWELDDPAGPGPRRRPPDPRRDPQPGRDSPRVHRLRVGLTRRRWRRLRSRAEQAAAASRSRSMSTR